ncbi:MAG: hypothetical protein AAGI90_01450 [Chlamydiota bacterium]
MKKFATAVTCACMLFFSANAHALKAQNGYKYKDKKGSAALYSSEASFDFAWPVAIGTLAILVTVATLAATSSTDRSPTFSQSS